jgi:lysophospholipase L1-like esterase
MTERVTAIEDTMEKWNGLDTILINPKTTRPKVLIFGDSISDSAHIKINTSNQTTEYWFADPSNHYTNSQGVTITYYMWPWFVNKILNCSDCRCYAMSGASYRTIERTEGNERQNLQFQIDLAMNDLTNPLSVFPTVGTYNPDIVIFALGINDGVPTTGEDYATTMAKTVFVDGGIDVDATIAAMDYTNRADAVHGAFLRVKKAFPYALTFAVLPIQTNKRDVDGEGTMNELIRLIAHRYSIHVIDGARDMGIVRDFCGDVDIYLKDGLHPNDKGQNLYTRLVLAAIRKEYINLEALNP